MSERLLFIFKLPWTVCQTSGIYKIYTHAFNESVSCQKSAQSEIKLIEWPDYFRRRQRQVVRIGWEKPLFTCFVL